MSKNKPRGFPIDFLTINWTNIWFFPSMDKSMCLEVTGTSERLVTAFIVTDIGSFSCMLAHMPLELVCTCKRPATALENINKNSNE